MISFIDLKEEKTALYLNFPFCKSPCSYCHYIDNLKFGYTTIPDEYVEMITIQLEYVLKQLSEKKLESIYFGGGTPSLLSNEQIKKIEEVFDKYQITSKEISIEVHPGMCNFDYANNSFFTRYSLGVQSFDKDIMDLYHRRGYTIASIVKMVEKIRESEFSKVINIDLIFDLLLTNIDLEYINRIKPETVTLYPNTKGRGIDRFEAVNSTLINAKNKLQEYNPLGKSKFIFIKNGCKQSFYSKNEYETNGNIIGIGHNSISYIGDKTYLCRYENNTIQFKERMNKGSRYFNSLLMGIQTGVLVSHIQMCMPEILKLHFLRAIKSDKDISDKHLTLNTSDLVYLPEDEYIRFYDYVFSSYGEQAAKIFLGSIGFGDGDYNVIEAYYNKKLLMSNKEQDMLRAKIVNLDKDTPLEKIKVPQMRLLVEGIDGSGKDTFVDMFVQELRKRFLYDDEYKISVMGQPDSSLVYGIEAKQFIENVKYSGNMKQVQEVLTENRLASERKIILNKGITILIRGIVTDKATVNSVFGEDGNLGEGVIIPKWDKYIVISVCPEIADARIENRGIPRTWREHIHYLKYFNEYYKNYSSPIFDEKIVIENTDLSRLRQVAVEMADDIYADQFNRR